MHLDEKSKAGYFNIYADKRVVIGVPITSNTYWQTFGSQQDLNLKCKMHKILECTFSYTCPCSGLIKSTSRHGP